MDHKKTLVISEDALTGKNKRKYIRHTVRKFAELVVNSSHYSGTVLNLSKGGSLIQAQGSFSNGDAITVTYQLDSGPIGEVRRTGIINRVTPTGIGIKFKRLGYSD